MGKKNNDNDYDMLLKNTSVLIMQTPLRQLKLYKWNNWVFLILNVNATPIDKVFSHDCSSVASLTVF